MDTIAGYQATIAALMALHHQRESGEGQYVDLSQVESGLVLNGTAILDAQLNARDLRVPTFPPGNRAVWPGADPGTAYRGELAAPYGLYPTAGGADYDYCAVTVMDDRQWDRLKGVLGRPAWAEAPEYATVEGRIAGQEDIDAHLREWTRGQKKYAVAALLQDAGIAAGALQSPEDRMEHDPQLKAREVFPAVTHPLIGEFRAESVPFLIDGRRPELVPQWPVLGEANRYVMTEIVGLSDDEYESAERDGLFWPADMERDYEFPQQLW
jgi:crotonobetainyl-CoA:carnitine CoA-transferase CaiB-like acyl-CoA transferase